MIINRTEHQFQYGNCAYIAIAEAFDMTTRQVSALFRMIDEHDEEGVTFRACQKVLGALAKSHNCSLKYTANKGRFSYQELVEMGAYKVLVNLSNHIGYVKEGEIYDDWLADGASEDVTRLMNYKGWVEGWWTIGRQPLRNFLA